jgi:hypothetical protein
MNKKYLMYQKNLTGGFWSGLTADGNAFKYTNKDEVVLKTTPEHKIILV